MKNYSAVKKFFRRQVDEHRQWFINNHGSERWKADYMAVLGATAYSQSVNFEKTPLLEPLSQQENDYHESGLRAAPATFDYGW